MCCTHGCIHSLDWNTGLRYFPFLDKFVCLFVEGCLHFLKSTSTWLLWMIVIITSCLLQANVIGFAKTGPNGTRTEIKTHGSESRGQGGSSKRRPDGLETRTREYFTGTRVVKFENAITEEP